MADGIVVVSTPTGDLEVSADIIAGLVHERVKLQIGDTDSAADVHAGNPVPVVEAVLRTILTGFPDANHADLVAIVAALQDTLTVSGAVAVLESPDLASTLDSDRKTSTSPGNAVPLVGAATPCKWVMVSALVSNANVVYVGDSNASAATGAQKGTPLYVYGSTVIPVDDAEKVFVDVATSGDGVSFTIGS